MASRARGQTAAGADLQARIAAAKQQAEQLKTDIEQDKASKANGSFSSKDELVDMNLPEMSLDFIPKCRRILSGHNDKVHAMHWAEDAQRMVSASKDGKLMIWNAYTTMKLQSIPLASSWVMTCAFEPSEGRIVACGGLDNKCSIYQVGQTAAMTQPKELCQHDGYLFRNSGSRR